MKASRRLINTLWGVLLGVGLLASAAVAQNYTVLKAFNSEGVYPHAGLIQGADGNLYGTTSSGGAEGLGTIFKIDSSGSMLTTLHSFTTSDGYTPNAGLLQGADGNLYGTTSNGGASPNSSGTIFKIDTNGTTFTVLHSFAGSDGATPVARLIQGTDGNLYGTTASGGAGNAGTVFKIDTNGTTLTTLHSFVNSDGENPNAGLIQGADGNLYGTTLYGGAGSCFGLGCGTIFKIDTNGTTLTTLHSFLDTDGRNPYAGLIQGTDGNLYGTTYQGGASGYGTIFKIDTNGSTFTTLHTFVSSDGANSRADLIQAADGNLYGTTNGGGANDYGTIFKIDTGGSTFTTLHSFAGSDGGYPYAGLVQATDGNLYGTTLAGGARNLGAIFKIDTDGATLTTLHSFTPYSDGAAPRGGLIQGTDGNLYGTTSSGGANGYGTIFKIDSNGSTLTTLHSFTNSGDGANPYAGVIQGADGNLYGTTYSGGANIYYGTIFKIDTNGTTFTTLHSFAYSDGANSYASLIQGTDGNLYGTTNLGGANGLGTIFKIDTNGTTFTSLHSFAGSDGYDPIAGLIQGADGNLYGTTYYGGANTYYGTIFKIDTNGTALTTLHSFANSDGAYPQAGLIQGADGNLYGTTSQGAPSGYGTVFKIYTDGTTFTTLHTFVSSDGTFPYAGLIQGVDGNLYGTTYSGGAGVYYGTVFEIDTSGTTLTTLHSFGVSDGANPYAGLIQGTDGGFYGTASFGGPAAGGVVFKIVPCSLSPPVITPGGPTTFCAGGSVTLDAGAGYSSYLWSPGGQTTQTIVVTASGSYKVTVTEATGCQGTSAPTVVTVNPNPVPVITPGGPTTFCAGGSLTLDAGAGYGSYLWSPGGQTTKTIVVSTSGSYSVTVVDANGCTGTSAPTVVTVNPNPTPVITPGGPTTFCAGGSVTLDAGAGYSSYLWSPGGQTTRTIVVTTSGSYTAAVTDVNGCTGTSAPTVVTVNPNPAPALTVSHCPPPNTPGLGASVAANAGDTYNWTIVGGTIDSGQGTNAISFTSGGPGTPMTLTVVETTAAACVGTGGDTLQVDFSDVPSGDPFYTFVCSIGRDGITAGCGNGDYCPGSPVTRAEMAVFLLKGEHGASYTPPACHGIFSDVPCPGGFAVDWIEQLSSEGITAGCGGGNYCPSDPVTRAQMAVFLLRAQRGPGYTPPACHGIFSDVPCPGGFAVNWIEQLSTEGITAGCGGGNYCPDASSTRGQMAVFLVKTFGLP